MPNGRTLAARGLPRIIDLFAGCGGMTRGFADAGFEPVLAVESDFAAACSYAANFGEEHILWQPIEDLEPEQLVDADVVIGGPPCQGFSNLGKRHSFDTRNGYWDHFVRVVAAVQPQVFVLENVDRFLKSSQFLRLQWEAEKGGRLSNYVIEPHSLNAANYGVAQRRQRAIVIGTRIGRLGQPTPSHSQYRTLTEQAWRTVRDEIWGLDANPPKDLPESQAAFFNQGIEGIFKGMDIHVGRTYQELSIRRFEHIPPGGNRTDIPEELLYDCWKRYTTGALDVMGRLRWDEPAVTVRTEFFKPEKGRYLHPQSNRKKQVNRALTHLEAARLQSFGDDFQWCGRKLEIARQIGNAVPPRLARAVASHVLPRLT
jgi:DNA (cytosine-5)-methyltransferase 1